CGPPAPSDSRACCSTPDRLGTRPERLPSGSWAGVAFVQDSERSIAETRRMTRLVLAVAIVAALAAPNGSQVQGAPGTSSPAADASRLSWMAGHWTGAAGALQMEEVWTGADGGALVGLHKDVATKNGAPRMVSFEFLRVEADGTSLV